jgi:putative phosphoesterase
LLLKQEFYNRVSGLNYGSYMKLAVLSDVHGNMPALQAVLEHVERWNPDKVIVNGDLVNRGPYSLQALQLVLDRFPNTIFLKGNHENFVLNCGTEEEPKSGAVYEMRRFSHWTYNQLGDEVDRIAKWEESLDLDDLEGGTLHITHGTRLGNRDGITPRTEDDELPEKIGDDRDIFITSHTHWPFIRRFNGTTVVNSGSVGTPFDRDYRSSYAQMSYSQGRWQAKIIRLDYDRPQTELDYEQSGFMDEGGPITKLMLMELRHARGFIGSWLRDYEAAVIKGDITLEDSINTHLEKMLGS